MVQALYRSNYSQNGDLKKLMNTFFNSRGWTLRVDAPFDYQAHTWSRVRDLELIAKVFRWAEMGNFHLPPYKPHMESILIPHWSKRLPTEIDIFNGIR